MRAGYLCVHIYDRDRVLVCDRALVGGEECVDHKDRNLGKCR